MRRFLSAISSMQISQALPKSHDARNVQRSRTHAALVAAAIDDGGNLHPRILAPHIQRADAFGAIHLVRRDRHDVDVHLVHVNRNLADCLGRVRVENHAALVAELADLGDGLHHADFVVRRHDRDQDGLVVHGALQFFQIDQAVFLHRQ